MKCTQYYKSVQYKSVHSIKVLFTCIGFTQDCHAYIISVVYVQYYIYKSYTFIQQKFVQFINCENYMLQNDIPYFDNIYMTM